jgi:hypothetical protein
VTAKVTLAILISQLPGAELPSAVAGRLAKLGGRLTGWHPVMNGAPARAYFSFESEDERERFLAGALNFPGVSIAET